MRNSILVEFGDDVRSIFYWSNVDSLQGLKESIKKRFNIHQDHQIIKHGQIALNEKLFHELYQKRFTENFTFDVQIAINDTFSSDIVKQQREDISMKSQSCQLEFPENDRVHTMDIKVKAESRIHQIKQHMHKEKPNMEMDAMIIITSINANAILDNDQLIADLLLDLDQGETLKLQLTRHQTERTERDYYDLLRPVQITIPYRDRHFKLDYPLMEIGCLGISILKSWVETMFRIPSEEQLVIFEGRVIQNELFPKHTYRYRLNTIHVQILVYSTSDQNLNSIYQEMEIKTMLPIHASSFGNSHIWQYHYRKAANQTLDDFLEETLQIPKQKQRLFINGRRTSASDIEKILISNGTKRQHNNTSQNHTENQQIYLAENLTFLDVKLVVQVNDNETELLNQVKFLGVSRIRSIIIKHPHNDDTIFYEYPLSQLEDTDKSTDINQTLCSLLVEKYENLSPMYICLLHEHSRITDVSDIHNFLVKGNTIQENLILTLAIYPNINENMQKFCKEHQMTFLKQINVKFLTGQFNIDALSMRVNSLSDIKNEIFRTKRIAPHLQTLYHDGIEQTDVGEKFKRFMTRMMTQESISLNLVAKPAKKVKVYVDANFLNEQMQVEILETATVLVLKEIISARSGIVPALILIGRNIANESGDDSPIWMVCYYINIVRAHKRVFVYLDNQGEIFRRDHLIQDLEEDTIRKLHKGYQIEYSLHGYNSVTIKNGLKANTLLKDLNEREVWFVIGYKQRCDIM